MLAKLDDFEIETIYISLILLPILSGSTGDEQTAREHWQAISTLWFYPSFDKHEKLKCSINIICDNIYKSKVVKFTNFESSKTWQTNIFQSTSSLDHLNKPDHFKLTNIKVCDSGKLTCAINIEFLSTSINHKFSNPRKLHFDKHEKPACFIKSELWQHRKQRNTHA